MANFTKRHYISIAEMFASMPETAGKARMIGKQCAEFAKDNARFSETTFRAACVFNGTRELLERCLSQS